MQDGSRVMWLDFGNSTIHHGLDRTSQLAQKALYELEACCRHADAMLAQRRRLTPQRIKEMNVILD